MLDHGDIGRCRRKSHQFSDDGRVLISNSVGASSKQSSAVFYQENYTDIKYKMVIDDIWDDGPLGSNVL